MAKSTENLNGNNSNRQSISSLQKASNQSKSNLVNATKLSGGAGSKVDLAPNETSAPLDTTQSSVLLDGTAQQQTFPVSDPVAGDDGSIHSKTKTGTSRRTASIAASKKSSKAPSVLLKGASKSVQSNTKSQSLAASKLKEEQEEIAAKLKAAQDLAAQEEKKALAREKLRLEKESRKRKQEVEKALAKKKEQEEKQKKEEKLRKEKARIERDAKKIEIPNEVYKIDPLAQIRPPSPDHSPAIGNSIALPTLPASVLGTPSDEKSKDPFPYRHFTPLHPCANRLLAMKWDRDDRKKHIKKLAAVKPKVDNCAPKLYRHLQTKPKKHQMDQERQAEIHRNNRILLERMSNIMYMEAHDPEIHATRRFQVLTNAGPRARAREQIKIALENKKLFERLQAKQPDYNRYKLLAQHYKHLAHLQNISCYPQKYMDQQAEYLGRLKSKTASGAGNKLPKIGGEKRAKSAADAIAV